LPEALGTEELAKNVSSAMTNHRACVAWGHGVFASGKNLMEAYTAVSMAKHSSQIKYLADLRRT
jgi:L-fuculose-phosphate aldolase